jgi:hypothetical protein
MKPNKEDVNHFDHMIEMLTKYVDAKEHYLIGIALWAMHTHVYSQYSRSPRLAILSPVPNCGKSTVLDILASTVWNSKRVIDPSVASTFRLANNHSLLIDEVDNMSILKAMRSVLNEGHSFGGSVTRVAPDGGVIEYPVYGPVALAGIGRLPATLMSRSLVVRLHRSTRTIERFSATHQSYESNLSYWAKREDLNPDPILPNQIKGRNKDKWLPLIAIADAFDRSDLARNAALAFINESDTLDIKESVLRDTGRMFGRIKTNILPCITLHQMLLEDKDGECEVDYVEQKITVRKIGDMLAAFQIRSKPHRYTANGVPVRCWFREDFTEMWERYA